jgi:hypothetical protein
LLQYESNTWQKDINEDITFLNLVSRMYAPVEWVKEYCEDKSNKKPLIQCELCHAMGNGPGDLEENFRQVYEYDNYCGGFVWEWCDHAVYAGEAENGKKKFLYGGDFGEYPHDGNFCIDGLVYPDRKVHTGLMEYKNVIRPIRLTNADIEQGRFTFENKLDFTNLKDYAIIRYEFKMGYYLAAINTNQNAAASLGVNVQRFKLKAMFISAFLTAIGGGFYASLIQFIDPERLLGYTLSVEIMTLAVVGGRGTLIGPILGAFIMVPISEFLRSYLGTSLSGISNIMYGLILMAIVFFMPGGLTPLFKKIGDKLFKSKKNSKEEVSQNV